MFSKTKIVVCCSILYLLCGCSNSCKDGHPWRQIYEKQLVEAQCETISGTRYKTLTHILWMWGEPGDTSLVGFLVSSDEFNAVDVGEWYSPSEKSLLLKRTSGLCLEPTVGVPSHIAGR
jgi:hypothetical protein